MAKDIVNKYLEDKAQVSRSLDYLEKNGYLNCNSNMTKRYNAIYTLTEKGLEVASYVSRQINNVFDKAAVGISNSEKEALYKNLELICNNLDLIIKENKND